MAVAVFITKSDVGAARSICSCIYIVNKVTNNVFILTLCIHNNQTEKR